MDFSAFSFGLDWLNLALRWAHLIVGIAWIGSSFYFVWQDNSLLPTAEDPQQKRLQGEVWMVHGGGFYHVRKFKTAPPDLPDHLHWFKWEAYATWLTGFALLVVVYYLSGPAWLLPGGSPLTATQGAMVGIGAIVVSWLVYDGLCRSPLSRSPWGLAAAVFGLVVVLAWGFSQVFTGRAAYLHVGAVLGTIMAANVLLVIIPNQRKLVAALQRGETPDPRYGLAGKTRSVHNTYFTLPVLFLMVSNHYPATYGHAWGWVILLALVVLGAGVRQIFLLRHHGRARPWMIPAAVAAFIALALTVHADRWLAPQESATFEAAEVVPLPLVQAIIEARCTACHSDPPTFPGFDVPGGGVVLAGPEDYLHWAEAIHAQAIATETMPLGNITNMSAEERTLLGRWLETRFAP